MCHPEVPAGQTAPEVIRQDVQIPVSGGETMPALLARPKGGSGGGVLIINDFFGRSPFYDDIAARLASAGFVALCPEYFFREGPLAERTRDAANARRGKLDERRTIDDLSAALDWLKRQPGVQGDRIGTLGFCVGGTMALVLDAYRRDTVTVCYYGFPAAPTKPQGGIPSPLSLAGQMKGPILGFWGDQDTGVGMPNVEKLAELLRDRNVDFDHTIYPGIGHGFMAASRFDAAHDAYDAACESWTRALTFYRRHLGAPVAA
jgi:carboxymethylenebutenolidase